MAPLPDPNRLLVLTDRVLRDLEAKDGPLLTSLLAAIASGNERIAKSARSALYEWAQTYLEPRFDQFQGWATELAIESYMVARSEAIGSDRFTPKPIDRGAGVDSFVGWMLSAVEAPTSSAALPLMQQGAGLRTIAAYNDTMTGNALVDPASDGWIRVAEPGACPFCLMLASRGSYGILYRSEQTANFRAHARTKRGGGECRCHALPVWDAGRVRRLGSMPDYAEDSPYAPYAADAAVFLDANGARGLVAA